MSDTCTCGSIGAAGLRLCPVCHRYWQGDRELFSVSRVIRDCWPIKKNWEAADPAVLEHARIRGQRVDAYFSEWLKTGYVSIAAGEWREVIDRTKALVGWWDASKVVGLPQVMLSDGEFAGTADVVVRDGFKAVYDVKNVAALDPTYWIQIGAYAEFDGIDNGGLIHVTQPRKGGELEPAKVKLVDVDVKEARADWRLLRDAWRMANRRAPQQRRTA